MPMDQLLQVVRRASRSFRRGNSIRPQRSSEGDEAATELNLSRKRIKELHKVYTEDECTCSIEEQRTAIQEIGHLAWLGGVECARYAAEMCFGSLACFLTEEDLSPLHKTIVITLSEIFQCTCVPECQDVRELAKECNLCELLLGFLSCGDKKLVKSSLHALFFLCCGSSPNEETLSSKQREELKMKASELSHLLTWSGWKHNEAEEVLQWCQNVSK